MSFFFCNPGTPFCLFKLGFEVLKGVVLFETVHKVVEVDCIIFHNLN